MDFIDSLWDLILVFFWAFIFIAALIVLFNVVTDLIRDDQLSGWAKAVWLIFLVCVPILTSIIYLVSRGRGMATRSVRAQQEARNATEDYIRHVAHTSPSDEIAKARALLDNGTIDADEFRRIKERILA